MNLFKAYYHYISNPAQALSQLFRQRAMQVALWGYFAAALSWVLFFNIADGLSAPAFLFKLMILFVAELTIGFISASFCSLFLDLSKIKNSPAELFMLVGTSEFIKGLFIAFALISAAFPFAKLGYLCPLALLLVLCLQIGFLTRNVMRVYQAKVGKALTAWLFAAVPFGVVFALAGIFFIWGIVLIA